jgi:predicted dinucleotide-binding enzyme
MKIGIVGGGNVGATAAALFVDAGHEVALSNSRGPDSLADLVADLGAGARAATTEAAIAFGDVVLLALPFRARESLPADAFAGKPVIDATNPYGPNFEVMDLGDDTSSELIAAELPDARVVKAFNTMYWETLRDEARPDAPEADRLTIFLAGDDLDDEAVVADLIRDAGFAPVDTGSLVEGGRRQEPGSPIYDEPMTPDEARDRLAAMGADGATE